MSRKISNFVLSIFFTTVIVFSIIFMPQKVSAQKMGQVYRIGVMGGSCTGDSYWVRCTEDGNECSWLPPVEFPCPE